MEQQINPPTLAEGNWQKTKYARDRISDENALLFEQPTKESPNGKHGDRPIIGRDTVINKGVYVGGGHREAVVVDDEKYPEELNKIYDKIISNASVPGGNFFNTIMSEVRGAMGGGQGESVLDAVDRIYDQLDKSQTLDPKVTLNRFINAKVGVCRHRALLAGYIIERAIREKKISGKVSIDRNDDGRVGHAWVRFTPESGGEPTIIDASLNFCDKLSEAPGKWDYRRPEDIK